MAPRRKGEYVPLFIGYMDDDAILSVSPLAELLYVRLLAVSGGLKADGYLTYAQIVHRAGTRLGAAKVPKLLAELVAAGPVQESDGGYRIRAWLEWNNSAEELRRAKAKDAERKRAERSGLPPDGPGSPPTIQAESSRTDPGLQPESRRSPNGVQPDSGGSPPSRAPVRVPPRAGHGTALHDTTTTEASLPREDPDLGSDEAVTAQSLVGEWVDHCATRPPGRTLGQVAKLLGEMLAEGVPAAAVRSGLARWHSAAVTDPNGKHPSTLPGFVHAAANAGTAFGPPAVAQAKPSTSDLRVQEAFNVGAEIRAKRAAAELADTMPPLRALPGGAA